MENHISTQDNQNNQNPKKGFFSTTKRKVIFSLIAFLILTGAFAGVSFAKKIYHLKKDGPVGMIIDKITEGMTLSNDQKTKIANLKNDIKEKMDSKKSDKKEKFEGFINEFKKDNLDKIVLENMFQKNEAERNEMRNFAESKIVEFHSILTPDQRIQAADKMEKMREKFHDKMENFEPGK